MGQYFSTTYYDADGNKKTRLAYHKIGIILLVIIVIILAFMMYNKYSKEVVSMPALASQFPASNPVQFFGGSVTFP